jgi:hypothetical protein
MASLKFKKGKEFLWAITKDRNEVYIIGKKFHRIEINPEGEAQRILDEVIINQKGGRIKCQR